MKVQGLRGTRDFYPEKMRKQFEYADAINAMKIIIVGERDLKQKKLL